MKGNHLLLTAATERIVLSGNDTVRYWYGPYGDDVPAPGQTTVQTSTTDNPYRFSGKERTPADYDFGARRYLPFRIPRGTTQDPMAEKYFSISPYAYCAGDPVNMVDPSGEKVYIFYTENGRTKSFLFTGQETSIPNNSFVQSFVAAYKYNKENWKKAGYKDQEPTSRLVEREEYVKLVFSGTAGNSFSATYDNRLAWNPEAGMLNEETGVILSPATGLAHEAAHANDYFDNREQHKKRVKQTNRTYDNEEEKRVITGPEQKTARANGEIKRGQVTRKNHLGKTVIVNGVTSTIINHIKTEIFNEQYKKDYWRALSSEW